MNIDIIKQAFYENAMNDLYYGYGFNFAMENDENAKILGEKVAKEIWKKAFNEMCKY